MVEKADAYEVPEAPREAGAEGNRTGAYLVREDRKRTETKQMPEICGGGCGSTEASVLIATFVVVDGASPLFDQV